MIRLWSLGDSLIEIGETRIGPDAEVLFATALVLVMERGHRVPRDRVIALLWPDAEEANGRHCLRQALYQLRRAGASIRVQGSALELPASEVVTDYEALTTDGAMPDAIDTGRLGGGFLATYRPRLSSALAEWVEAQRAVVHASARRVLLRAIADHRSRSDWGRVESLARACLVVDPLNEEATLALAEAVALAGAKAEAVGILDRFLSELGPAARDLRIPASVLRRRIAERLPHVSYGAPRETPLFGRGELMATLTADLRQARDGAGRGCLLVGAPGIGKSRLAAELGRVATLDGLQLQRTMCHPGDAQRPLSAFVDLVPGLLMLPGAIGCSPTSMAYLRRLTEHDPDAPSLTEDEHDAAMRYARLRRALFDLVDAVASEGSMMLVVENVHWLDPLSWSLFREMVEWGATRRVLFVFTSRPEGTATREPDPTPGLRVLPVPPLATPGATDLLDALAGARRDDLSPAARDWYLASAEGNPLYLRELVTHWLETGATYSAPTSLMELIQQRVARLSPRARRVLQVCAVLGKSGTISRMEKVLEYPRFELIESVEELESAGLLTTHGTSVACRHDLIAEASTVSLAPGTQRLLHRSVALVLEEEIPSAQTSPLVWDCAHHWQKADERERALNLIRRCAEQLLELGLVSDELEIVDQALSSPSTAAERVVLLDLRVRGLAAMDSWVALLATLNDVEEESHRIQAPLSVPLHLLRLQAEWRLRGASSDLHARALSLSHSLKLSAEERLQALTWALIFADNRLDLTAAMNIMEAATPLIYEGSGCTDRSKNRFQMIFHSTFGNLDEAVTFARRIVEEERISARAATLIPALRHSTIPLRRAGAIDEARQNALEALRRADAEGMFVQSYRACDILLAMALDEASTDEAVRWHDHALTYAQDVGDRLATSDFAVSAARLAFLRGDLSNARKLVARIAGSVDEPNLRIAIAAISVEIRSALAAEDDWNQTLLRRLIELHLRVRSFGGHDFAAIATFEATCALGRPEKALEQLIDYAQVHRREKSPLPLEIAAIIKSSGNFLS